MLSSTITLERGVLQGSVLSPTLFLLVIDPFLRELERRSVGPCLRELYCGAFAHADDIRTISTSRDTLHEQISIVESFTTTNALVLNAQKCEVVVVSSTKSADVAVQLAIKGTCSTISKEAFPCFPNSFIDGFVRGEIP